MAAGARKDGIFLHWAVLNAELPALSPKFGEIYAKFGPKNRSSGVAIVHGGPEAECEGWETWVSAYGRGVDVWFESCQVG